MATAAAAVLPTVSATHVYISNDKQIRTQISQAHYTHIYIHTFIHISYIAED